MRPISSPRPTGRNDRRLLEPHRRPGRQVLRRASSDHAHCRNCPTYSAAATTLLDREHADGFAFGPGAAHYAEGQQAERREGPRPPSCSGSAPNGSRCRHAVFDEVAELRAIHSLPHRRSPAVLGLVNVRGELVVCVSLAAPARIAGGDARRRRSRSVRLGRHALATRAARFPVDEVQRTHRYHDGRTAAAARHRRQVRSQLHHGHCCRGRTDGRLPRRRPSPRRFEQEPRMTGTTQPALDARLFRVEARARPGPDRRPAGAGAGSAGAPTSSKPACAPPIRSRARRGSSISTPA